jgi:cell division protein FtsB
MLSKLLFNPITLVAITAFSLVFSLSLYNSAKKTRESAQQLNVLEQNITTMEEQLKTLEQTAQEAQQPFTKEKIIRDELLMQKPGEYIVQIPDETSEEVAALQASPTPKPWDEWKKILF